MHTDAACGFPNASDLIRQYHKNTGLCIYPPQLFKILNFRLLNVLIAVTASILPALAVPAKPGLMRFDNGGSPIEVYLHGDEHSHYYTTSDGYMLLRGDDEVFRYAVPEGDVLKPSAMKASMPAARTADEEILLASFPKNKALDIFRNTSDAHRSRRKPARVAEESGLCTFPTKGSPRCLALLVEFQDVKFTLPNPGQLFSDMLNRENFTEYGATGSVHDYLAASSNGQFTPQFDVYGPVTLPYNMSYYGGNDPKTGDDARPYEMVPHAVELLKDQIDFSVYDNDNDGVVDNIYIFYAGYGEADGGPANSVWPHSWNIHDDLGMDIYMNGKLINHYATNNELANGQGSNLAGIGVFCHEFSHVLGLPDLYSTIYTSTFTPGAWSLMDYGSYNNDAHTPPTHTGYERYCLGWVEPKLLSDPENVTMYPVSQIGAFDDVYMIKTPKNQEYYILENRQQRAWDEYVPGHGMLVWHIDFVPDVWLLNIINIEKQYVDIVEADDERSYYSIAGDTFPGTAGVTEFTDSSVPSMRTWDGVALHSPITDIKENNGVISFAFKGGRNIFDEMVAREAAEVKAGGFTAVWNEIPKTTGYILSVYQKEGDVKKYVDGYLKREVGATGSFEVTGLTPSTTYYYVVAGTNGRFYSADSNEIEVTTLEPTLDYKRVAALAATEVGETSFRANWELLDDADYYEVTLHKLRLGEPFGFTAGFTDREIPEGWQSDASFDGRASYAVEIPSLRMTADGSYVSTSAFDGGVRRLSFWHRAASNASESSLDIYAMLNGEWCKFHTVSPLCSAAGGEIVTLDNVPDGASKIRIEFVQNGSGSVSIDDVTIGYGGNVDYFPVEGKEAINAGNSDSLFIDGLENHTDYGYTVTAVNSEFRSLPSSMTGVTTGSSSVVVVKAGGILVSTERLHIDVAAADAVSVFDVSGRLLGSSAGGRLSLTLPGGGIYIVKSGAETFKVRI